MEWARRLTADDIKVLQSEAPYSEKVPDVDEGFTREDLKDADKAEAVYKVIRARLEKAKQDRPKGYLVREAPAEDLRQLFFPIPLLVSLELPNPVHQMRELRLEYSFLSIFRQVPVRFLY